MMGSMSTLPYLMSVSEGGSHVVAMLGENLLK